MGDIVLSDIWIVFLEMVLPFIVVEFVGALVWRFVVVEGRLSSRTLEGETDLLEMDVDTDDGDAVDLENELRALEQRVAELEELLE